MLRSRKVPPTWLASSTCPMICIPSQAENTPSNHSWPTVNTYCVESTQLIPCDSVTSVCTGTAPAYGHVNKLQELIRGMELLQSYVACWAGGAAQQTGRTGGHVVTPMMLQFGLHCTATKPRRRKHPMAAPEHRSSGVITPCDSWQPLPLQPVQCILVQALQGHRTPGIPKLDTGKRTYLQLFRARAHRALLDSCLGRL